MKFLIDAHLPESICECFPGCDCLHARLLKEGNQTKDSYLNELSIKEKRVVITKDTDFYYSFMAGRKPYKLVLVKLGNIRLAELKEYFKNNGSTITNLMEIHSFIILEKNNIKVLD